MLLWIKAYKAFVWNITIYMSINRTVGNFALYFVLLFNLFFYSVRFIDAAGFPIGGRRYLSFNGGSFLHSILIANHTSRERTRKCRWRPILSNHCIEFVCFIEISMNISICRQKFESMMVVSHANAQDIFMCWIKWRYERRHCGSFHTLTFSFIPSSVFFLPFISFTFQDLAVVGVLNFISCLVFVVQHYCTNIILRIFYWKSFVVK